MKLRQEHKKLLTLVMLSLAALMLIYISISFVQLTFNFADWWAGSRVALIIFWVTFTVFAGINLYSEDD
jgi:membrane protein YdbS with pleckstrin-like domain